MENMTMKYFNVDRNVYDPWEYATQTEDGRFILKLPYKKAWFRSKFPEGVIRYGEVIASDEYVSVEAFVYEKSKHTGDRYIGRAKAYATLQKTQPDKYMSAVERRLAMENLARGLAASKALTDAGFGLQFSIYEDSPETDPETTFENGEKACANLPLPGGTAPQTESQLEKMVEENTVKPLEDTTPAQEKEEKADVVAVITKPELVPASVNGSSVTEKNTTVVPKPASASTPKTLTFADVPDMDLEEARKVRVDCGVNHNPKDPQSSKTVGEISEGPKATCLKWVFKNTKSMDVRAAIKACVMANELLKPVFEDAGIM